MKRMAVLAVLGALLAVALPACGIDAENRRAGNVGTDVGTSASRQSRTTCLPPITGGATKRSAEICRFPRS